VTEITVRSSEGGSQRDAGITENFVATSGSAQREAVDVEPGVVTSKGI